MARRSERKGRSFTEEKETRARSGNCEREKFPCALPRDKIGGSKRQARIWLAWRCWLTQRLIERNFYNRAYYRIHSSESVHNPGQRIAEDMKLFTASVLNFFLVIVNSVVTLAGFLFVLWFISGKLVAFHFLISFPFRKFPF